MSLYNNIALSLSGNGLTRSVTSTAENLSNGIGSQTSKLMGGGELAQAAGNIIGAMGRNAAMNEVNKHIPIQAQRGLNVGAGAVGDLMRGDINSAGLRILDSGLLNDILPGMSGVAAQAMYWNRPTPLFGGITPREALKIHNDMRSVQFSKKNLFLVEVSSPLMGDWISSWFNMFATELDYAPMTISGDKKRVGSAVLDSIQSSEPVELRITTLDDKFGTIKRWYEQHHNATAAQDGTVGTPSQYAIRFKIVHSFITRSSAPYGAYESIGWFRPSSLEISLSRRDDALQEVQMTFSQIDTFVKA